MWLSRFELSKELAFSARAFDSYDWHQKLWDFFPDHPDASRKFLWRLDELERGYQLWILSPAKPLCPTWLPASEFVAPKEVPTKFFQYPKYHFAIRVNATKCISEPNKDGIMPRHGKRVPLIKESDLTDWLKRKGEAGGFSVLPDAFEIGPVVKHHFRKKGREGYHAGVDFRGMISITNRDVFFETYRQGIGGAKGFGFGMFLLAPIV